MRRLLLLCVVVIAVMFYVGWLTFRNEDSQSTITIDKAEIKADAEQASDKVQGALDDAKGALHEATESP